MFLARIIHKITSSHKHEAYNGKSVFIVRAVNPDGSDAGEETIAVDYVGASAGDMVVCGGAPGVARTVFELDEAPPIRTLIMAVVDSIESSVVRKEGA
ncbi:MAG TPA: EutN/CcmL family microcompartment protein [Bacteroidota bacterium]|nr:EutN/CcmL family microcompartment protein [Bacteroidota bacterium]